MRITKAIKIDDKEITLRELTIEELLFLCSQAGWISEVPGLKFEKEKKLPLQEVAIQFLSDLKVSDLYTFAPSDIEKLYTQILEVNKVTFSVLKYIGINGIIEEIKSNLVNSFLTDWETVIGTKKKNK